MAHMLRLTPCHSLTALPLHAVPRLYVLRLFVQCAQFERPDPNVSSTVLRHFGKRLFRLLCLSAIVIHFACFVRCSLRGHQRHGVPAVGLPPAVLRLDLALLRRVGRTRHPRLPHWFVLAQHGFRLLARSLIDVLRRHSGLLPVLAAQLPQAQKRTVGAIPNRIPLPRYAHSAASVSTLLICPAFAVCNGIAYQPSRFMFELVDMINKIT